MKERAAGKGFVYINDTIKKEGKQKESAKSKAKTSKEKSKRKK